MSIHDSNGAIITTVNASDPDNERNDKQRLSYSMDDRLYDGVFQLKDNHIFKSKVELIDKDIFCNVETGVIIMSSSRAIYTSSHTQQVALCESTFLFFFRKFQKFKIFHLPSL